MGCYRHLTRDDREEIAALRAAGHSMRAVAAAVGKPLHFTLELSPPPKRTSILNRASSNSFSTE